jgi:hypothetical protein
MMKLGYHQTPLLTAVVVMCRRLVILILLLVCCVTTFKLFNSPSIVTEDEKITVTKYGSSNRHLRALDRWSALFDDDTLAVTQIFFRHATSLRNSSYPFISGDTFRALADHIFDETTEMSQWPDRVWQIRRGDIVFLGSPKHMLEQFFAKITFNRILHPFVLVTHNSDASVPTDEFRWPLNTDKLLAWFTQNPDYEHRKLFPIPIGLANVRWSHGNVTIFKKAFHLHRKPFHQRTTLMYVNFAISTNEVARSKALKWALGLANVTQRKSVPLETYLKEIGNAKFVLSPPGNGLDCHRTWEAMLMGAIPIVLRSQLNPLFSNENALIVDDWNHLTLDYLKSLDYEAIPSRVLSAKYWYERLLNAAGHI